MARMESKGGATRYAGSFCRRYRACRLIWKRSTPLAKLSSRTSNRRDLFAGSRLCFTITATPAGQTYQHCLLVTGIAVTFGRQLGFSDSDKRKLAFAGLLHDIGKAKIPLAILEKPAPLDAAEIEVMKQHPLLGYETLQNMQGI